MLCLVVNLDVSPPPITLSDLMQSDGEDMIKKFRLNGKWYGRLELPKHTEHRNPKGYITEILKYFSKIMMYNM